MKQMKQNTNKNYMVLLYENGYPNIGGIATLIGVYPTSRAASFISKAVKERNRLPFFPLVEATDHPPTTTTVEHYLDKQDEAKKFANRNRQMQN